MASDRGRSASPSRDRRNTYHARDTHQGSRSRSPTKERRQHQSSSRGGRSRSRSIDKQRGRSRSISKSRDRRGYRHKESSIDRERRGTRPRSRSRSRRRSQSPAEYRLQNRYHGRDRSPRAGDSRHGPALRGSARIPEADRIRQQQQRDRSRDRGRDRSRDRGRDRSRDRGRDRSRDRGRDRSRDRGRDGSREPQHTTRDPQLQPYSPRFPGPPAHHGRSRWEQSDSAAPGRPHSNRSLQQQHGDHGRTAAPNEHLARRAPLSDAPPDVNSIHKGLIQTIKPFGVFIAIQGFRKHVLVHHSQVSADVMLTRGDDDDLKVKALEYVAPVGQQVYVKILEVSPDQAGPGFRVHGSMRLVDQAEGADMDPTGQMAAALAKSGGGRLSDEPPEVGSLHRGEVKRVEAYGVFVALQGYRKYGLVHASQVANYLEFSSEDSEADRKKALGEVVEVGQDVWVKVVEVGEDARGPKIGCSMKLVDQADGTDLDPQNMRYRPRGEAGAGGHHSKAPIGASAGEVGKAGTIDWGYLQTRPDQFGSKGYDLLDEEQQQQRQQPGVGQADMSQGQRPQQQLPAVGRGRGAVMPAWMTGGAASAPAAPGSLQHQPSADAKMSVEEALRIIHEAAGDKHKKAHKKHKKHKHKKSSNHKKSSKSSKHKSHKHKRKSGGGSDSGSSTSSSSGSE